MPRKPKRPCRYPGCVKLADGVYCKEHAKLMNAYYNRFARGYDSSERYGSNWKKIRNRYIALHPLCEKCFASGKCKTAVLVHHKVPVADGGTSDESNLMSLCSSCHEKIHGGGRG